MRKSIKIFMTSAALLLLGSGVAGAATTQTQIQLQGMLIPKFVEPLPLLEFEFVNATNQDFTHAGVLGTDDPSYAQLTTGLNGTPFDINAHEFRSQILPTPANWLTAPAGCGADTASSTFGYISNPARLAAPILDTYLGPVVIAERGITARPTYGNNLPMNGVVQSNLPIDQTLDWAMGPTNGTGPSGCYDASGVLTSTCQNIPYIGEMPIATHLHGGEVPPAFDGGPDAWFTQGNATVGSGWPGSQYEYPNNQQESLIWFHDHALGLTRLNVFAGLAGIQPIIDTNLANAPLTTLPQLADGYHVPLILQDRTFDTSCEIMYNLASNPMPNPLVHPFWIPEFIGDTIVVNGKTWPYFNVEPRQYRFSFVNGSNSRFYELSLRSSDDPVTGYTGEKMPMLVIATDDGYLMNAASTNMLVIGPGERYEVIVDFKVDGQGTPLPAGNMPVMWNRARTPYPGGGAVVPNLTNMVMQFRVQPTASAVPDTNVLPLSPIRATPYYDIKMAHDTYSGANTGSITRQLTLNETSSLLGPLELVVNNSKFNKTMLDPTSCATTACRETEVPAVGDTEIWEIINISADAHPMHTHLTSFQVINRQPFDAAKYTAAYDGWRNMNAVGDGEGPPFQYNHTNADGAIGGNPAVGPYIRKRDKVRAPEPYEMGWKDTVIAYPGEVTRIAIRWAPTDIAVGATTLGTNQYVGFNPTNLQEDPNNPGDYNVGYVWHCHIVDHEDNEMMRNYTVSAGTGGNPTGRQNVIIDGTF